MFDTLIKNGLIVDGSGAPAYLGDVGIEGDRITFVGHAGEAQAVSTIDATGKVISPGFIDPHSHVDMALIRADHVALTEPLIRQGMTTFIGGNCGASLAPIDDFNNPYLQDYIGLFADLDFNSPLPWKSIGDYLSLIEQQRPCLNMALLVPHGLLRINTLANEHRYATDNELGTMAHSLEQGLDEGAIGLSTGLQYFPGNQSDTRELLFLGKSLKKKDGIFTSHLRSYSNSLTKALDEVIAVSRENDIRAQISHLFWLPDLGIFAPLFRKLIHGASYLSQWWMPPIRMDSYLRGRIRYVMKAREKGANVGIDVMPTTSSFTFLLAYFPSWALEGRREEIVERLRDPHYRARVLHAINYGKMTWPHKDGDSWSLNLFRLMGFEGSCIMAVGSEKNRHLEFKKLVDIAREQHKHPFDAMCDLLLEENGKVLSYMSMAEPDDRLTEQFTISPIQHSEVSISTDTIISSYGKPSQLSYGCYPKFLGRYVRDMKLLTLESAIRKITSVPAEQFALKNRGKIEKNYFADLVVFDLNTIASRSTFEHPDQHPVGIDHVIINGRHVLNGDVFDDTTRSGRVLRNGR